MEAAAINDIRPTTWQRKLNLRRCPLLINHFQICYHYLFDRLMQPNCL